jgi:hypothetical protein
MRRIGRDPEVRYAQSGTTIANLRIATNERRPDGNGGWVALLGVDTLSGCFLYWDEQAGLFQDVSCLGARYTPDGRYLAFIGPSANEEAGRLFVRQLESGHDQEIPDTEGSSYPFWSPDSTHIAFFSRTKLRLVALAGGPATDLAPTPDGRGGTPHRGTSPRDRQCCGAPRDRDHA